MATKRIMVETTKYGGRDSSGNPMTYTGFAPVDVKIPDVIPEGTPRFSNVADDAAVIESEATFARLVAGVESSKAAIEHAQSEYQAAMDSYTQRGETIERVEIAEQRLLRAKAVQIATIRGLEPAKRAVVAARRVAVENGRSAFQEEVKKLAEERAVLLAQLKHVDDWYSDVLHSFQATDNLSARFQATRLDSQNDFGTGYEFSLNAYLYGGLTLPTDEPIEEDAPRNILMSWTSPR